jgi:hypothetical protein
MSGGGDADAYYRAIEEEFNRLRGAPLLLSPRDWALIGEWREAGVPLRVALQGIANVFESFARRGPTARRVNSLSYCRQEVLGLHEIYLGLRGAAAGRPAAGDAGGAARAGLRLLTRLARRVREALSAASEAQQDPVVEALARVASELKRLRREAKAETLDPAALDEYLRQLDGTLLEAARAALPGEEIARFEGEADDALGDRRARMTAEALAATRASHVAGSLRRACRLPRLTLFD